MQAFLNKIQEEEIKCRWDEKSRGHFVYHWANELKSNNLCKVCLPQECGGKNLELYEFMELTRKLSYIDGNLGWRFQIANGATYFFKNFHEEKAKSLFSENKLLISGSGSPSGKGKPTDNGYIIHGIWDYCSGSDIATHISFVFSDEKNNETVAAIIPIKNTITFLPNEFSGMQHTSTCQLILENMYVSKENCFQVSVIKNNRKLPAFEPDFDVFARAFFLPVAIGIFERYLHELSLAPSAKFPFADEHLKSLSNYQIVYSKLLEKVKCRDFSNFNLAVTEFIKKLKYELISSIHFAGMNGLKKNHPVNYTFQNFLAVTQHYLLN